jgi:hypothetical protein
MAEEDGLAKRHRGHDEINEQDCIQISPFLVLAKLFDTPRHGNFGAAEQTQVFSPAYDCATHIFFFFAPRVFLV